MRLALALMIVVLAPALAATAQEGRAQALEERLMAPCCWTQTLDAHDSPEARELRAEIERRLAGGESVAEVEADLVARYGERIRAVPHEGFLDPIGLGVVAVLAGTAIALLVLGRRWSRRAGEPQEPEDAPVGDAAELDARLEDELERLPEV